jgi:hypothetical protein
VRPFSVRHRLEIAEIDHYNGTAGYYSDNDHFTRVMVPTGPTLAAEAVQLGLRMGSIEGIGATGMEIGRDRRGVERELGFRNGAESRGGGCRCLATEDGGKRRSHSIKEIHRWIWLLFVRSGPEREGNGCQVE